MSRIPDSADVVVIGGGPAGSTAANLLAKYGYEVVLLEQVSHPRPSVGESVLPHFWKYADELGATDAIERAGFIRKSGATGIWDGVIRQLKLADFGHIRPSLHVERDEFDEIFLRACQSRGAAVFEQVSATSVQVSPELTRVDYRDSVTGDGGSISCKYVVDASGQSALIAKQFGFRHFDNDLRFMSVWGYFENSQYIAEGGIVCPFEQRREVRPTTLQLGIGGWSWCWQIVQKEFTSIGLVLASSEAADFKKGAEKLEQRFYKACTELPVLSRLLEEAQLLPGSVRAIRDFAYHPEQLAGEGWFLTGDSAAFVDPVNSAGVITAFYAGSSAAAAIHASLQRPERRQYYANIYATLLRQRLSLLRVAALPPGRNSYPDDIDAAFRAAGFDSRKEQELLFAQTLVMNRRENLLPLYERDPRLNYVAAPKYREISELVFPISTGSPAAS